MTNDAPVRSEKPTTAPPNAAVCRRPLLTGWKRGCDYSHRRTLTKMEGGEICGKKQLAIQLIYRDPSTRRCNKTVAFAWASPSPNEIPLEGK